MKVATAKADDLTGYDAMIESLDWITRKFARNTAPLRELLQLWQCHKYHGRDIPPELRAETETQLKRLRQLYG